jgi:hypothetical protein
MKMNNTTFNSWSANTWENNLWSNSEVIIIPIGDIVSYVDLKNMLTNEQISIKIKEGKFILPPSYKGVKVNSVAYTASGGIYNFQIQSTLSLFSTQIVFEKINFDFTINRDGNLISIESGLSFVSTDVISLNVKNVENVLGFNPLDRQKIDSFLNSAQWLISGVQPNDLADNTYAGFGSNFKFAPNPINRPRTGSRTPNLPIRYKVSVTIMGLKKVLNLVQDEIDILRQEYIDFQTNWIPSRNEIHLAENSAWNTGNYRYIATEAGNVFEDAFNSISNSWADACQLANIENPGLTLNSAYRNPRRTIAVGSPSVNSKHTLGRAMDIVPSGGTININTWIRLKNAAISAGYQDSHCDNSGTWVDNNCGQANHIHVQW